MQNFNGLKSDEKEKELRTTTSERREMHESGDKIGERETRDGEETSKLEQGFFLSFVLSTNNFISETLYFTNINMCFIFQF